MERCIGIQRFLDDVTECCVWWEGLLFHILVLSDSYQCTDTGYCDRIVVVTLVPPGK
jgi:hypothetical protein